MHYLYDHLKKGSFRLSYCDTDSITIGFSETLPIQSDMSIEEYHRAVFDPIIRPDMRSSWEDTWRDHFVLTKKVEDCRRPGLFKRMRLFIQSLYNILI